MDLVTALVVIVVILLVYQLTKKSNLAVVTEDGKLEHAVLSLASGFLAWKLMGQMNMDHQVMGADEDNVLEPSNLSLDEY